MRGAASVVPRGRARVVCGPCVLDGGARTYREIVGRHFAHDTGLYDGAAHEHSVDPHVHGHAVRPVSRGRERRSIHGCAGASWADAAATGSFGAGAAEKHSCAKPGSRLRERFGDGVRGAERRPRGAIARVRRRRRRGAAMDPPRADGSAGRRVARGAYDRAQSGQRLPVECVHEGRCRVGQ